VIGEASLDGGPKQKQKSTSAERIVGVSRSARPPSIASGYLRVAGRCPDYADCRYLGMTNASHGERRPD
jgi:hypothetical protein